MNINPFLLKLRCIKLMLILGWMITNFSFCLPDLPLTKKQILLLQAYLLLYPNIEISSESSEISEGLTMNISIRLKSQPSSGVLVPITFNSEVAYLNLHSLYFSPENWNSWQTIQLYAPEDEYYVETHSTYVGYGPFQSDDILYTGKSNTFNLKYINNEQVGIWKNDVHLVEGGFTQYLYISLLSRPRDNVYVNVINPSSSDLTFSTTSLTFTPINWNSSQHIQITPIDDILLEYDESYDIVIRTTSNDRYYNDLEYKSRVYISDNDIPGIALSNDNFTLTEGNSQVVNIWFVGLPPTQNILVSITSSNPSLCTISSGSSLTFTPSNYNAQQNFTVQARIADNIDNLDNGYSEQNRCIVNITTTSLDSHYNGLNRNVFTRIFDNVDAGIIFSPTNINLYESESTGTGIPFTMRLRSLPTSPVKICLRSSNYCEVVVESLGIQAPDGSCTPIAGVNTPYVVFNNSDWNIDKTIRIKPRHDWDYRSTPTETGNTCNPPYPDEVKSYRIRLYTHCPSCNEYEQQVYNKNNTEFVNGPSGNVYDDLDYFAFLTAPHNGDFANDPNLMGSNVILKIDSYCTRQRPHGVTGFYQAFIANGTNRSACLNPPTCTSKRNWVLYSNRYYFRYDDNQLMFKTDNNNLFILSDPDSFGIYGSANIWTGITPQWTDSPNNCNNWGDNTSSYNASFGAPNTNTSNALSNDPATIACNNAIRILCIEQY